MKIIIALIVSLISLNVNAICTQKNMAGTWHDYALGYGSQTVAWCKFVIDKNGNVTSGSCTNYNATTDYPPVYVNQGNFQLDRSCHITGSLAGDNGINAFLMGQMDRSFNSFAAISRNSSGNIAHHNFVNVVNIGNMDLKELRPEIKIHNNSAAFVALSNISTNLIQAYLL